MDRQQWAESLFKSIDSMDTDKFCEFLTDDARFRFGNGEVIEGREQIRQMIAGFFASLKGLSHTVTDMIEQDGALVCRGEVTYTRKDDSELTVPYSNFFRLDGERVSDYQIYIDASRLYA
jgi:ketosteroid isomerase-like protein